MAGVSVEHNQIVFNLARALDNQILDKPCVAFVNDMRVQVSATSQYIYPDAVVACGKPGFADDNKDTLLNPTVIFEVLSPSTEAYDRGLKFVHYRRLESLMEYVLVSQDKALVEHYVRVDDKTETWLLSTMSSLGDMLLLKSVGCEIALRNLYNRVDFPSIDEGLQLESAQ